MSRRAAEESIRRGDVAVNGVTASIGDSADPETDEITVCGAPLTPGEGKKYYIMLNKPAGYVTTMSDERGRRTVAQLVSDVPARVYPVGRLDYDSDGLLIMTNDGEFANHIMHPSGQKDKTYRVLVTGDAVSGVKRLLGPMELDGVALCRPRVRRLRSDGDASLLEITIHEGKNRQIRRMCAIAGLTVKRLTRVSVGGVELGELKSGAWRELTEGEIEALRG